MYSEGRYTCSMLIYNCNYTLDGVTSVAFYIYVSECTSYGDFQFHRQQPMSELRRFRSDSSLLITYAATTQIQRPLQLFRSGPTTPHDGLKLFFAQTPSGHLRAIIWSLSRTSGVSRESFRAKISTLLHLTSAVAQHAHQTVTRPYWKRKPSSTGHLSSSASSPHRHIGQTLSVASFQTTSSHTLPNIIPCRLLYAIGANTQLTTVSPQSSLELANQ